MVVPVGEHWQVTAKWTEDGWFNFWARHEITQRDRAIQSARHAIREGALEARVEAISAHIVHTFTKED